MPSGSTATSGKFVRPRSDMGIFRRHKSDETLNEQLLHDAGLDSAANAEPQPSDSEPFDNEPPEPVDPFEGTYPAEVVEGIWFKAMARPGEYDTVVTVHAPDIPGDSVSFATLPSGDVIVDSEQGDADLSAFAEAVEEHLRPPYRVIARRHEDDVWSVAGRGIDVLELDFAGGDEIELASVDGEIDLKVDGEPWNERIPALEQAGEAAEGEDYVVQAERLDGNLWEVRASPL
jgi:hypothetical protein